MRALITGGAGFIGSALTRHLVAQLGWSVTVVDKLTYAGHLSSLAEVADSPNFAFVKADIADRATLTTALTAARPDIIFHLAAESHVDRSISGAGEFIATNIAGTFSLLECARDYWMRLPNAAQDRFRFLHVSTDEVYGSLGDTGAFSETTAYDPRSPYSASKAASDHLVSAWRHTYGFPSLISNCSNNYGPFQLPEKLIPLIILNGIEGKQLPVYGDGRNVRDWLYVDDHVEALCVLALKGRVGRNYNIGGRSERSNIDVVRSVCALLDRHAPKERSACDLIAFVADRPGHDHRYAVDVSRIESELGWRPSMSFEEGLERTVRWYLENEVWWAPLRGLSQKRLGLSDKAGAA